jgi:glutamate/tyrosine decarboxylase-like PLP-dependent enzyme
MTLVSASGQPVHEEATGLLLHTLAGDRQFHRVRRPNAVREGGWLVPAYTFPKNRTDLSVLRVVVRRGFSHDMADLFVGDLERQLPRLKSQAAPLHDGEGATGFHH